MKTTLFILLTSTLTLTSCGTNWQELGQKVGTAALDASIPIISDAVVTKPAAKQPVNVQP